MKTKHLSRRLVFLLVGALVLSLFGIGPGPTAPASAAHGEMEDYSSQATRVVRVETTAQLKTAVAAALPGDVIVLADGTYTSTSSVHILNKQGTEEQPIVITAENKGRVDITGSMWFFIEDSSYVVLQGMNILTDGTRGVLLRDTDHTRIAHNRFALTERENRTSLWMAIDGLQGGYNRIDHNLFENKTQRGNFILLDGTTGYPTTSPHNRIDHNHFRNMSPLGGNAMEAIRIGGSVPDYNFQTVIEYNLFEQCDGEQAEIISVKSGGNMIRYNTFWETQGSVTFRMGDGNAAIGNYFIGNGKPLTGGIRIYGEDQTVVNNYFYGLAGGGTLSALVIGSGDRVGLTGSGTYSQVQRATIAFNTLVDNFSGILIAYPETNPYPPEDTVIANNVVRGNDSGRLVFLKEPASDIVWEGNIMYAPGGSGFGLPGAVDEEVLFADPGLVAGSDGIYRPGTGSPVIDAALGSYPGVTDDLEGKLRDTAPDVGAFEYSSALPVRSPVWPTPMLKGVSGGPLTTGTAVYATSSEDGILYLVPYGTEATQSAIIAAATSNGSMTTATAEVEAPLGSSGLATNLYQVYAIDASGRISEGSGYIAIVAALSANVEDDNPIVRAVGDWLTETNAGDSSGSSKVSEVPGSYLTIPFYGAEARILSPRGSDYGQVKIYVDGVYQATVDAYNPTAERGWELYRTGVLSEGLHTITLEAADGLKTGFDVLEVLP